MHPAVCINAGALLYCTCFAAGRSLAILTLSGQNINVVWSTDGLHVAVGNKKDVITIIECTTYSVIHTQRFEMEVSDTHAHMGDGCCVPVSVCPCCVVCSLFDVCAAVVR